MQLMHPPVHISTATTFPRRPASVNAWPLVLNQGPPPMKSGAVTGPPAPPGRAVTPRTVSPSSMASRKRIGSPPAESLLQAKRQLLRFDNDHGRGGPPGRLLRGRDARERPTGS